LKKLFTIFFILIQILNTNLLSQEIPHSINSKGIYDFLDELANIHLIEINSAIKPYSRLYIANRLKEAEEKREELNLRQQKELEFYMLDFGKEEDKKGYEGMKVWRYEGKKPIGTRKQDARRRDLFYYRDSLFSLTINPILGGELFNNSDGKATYWRNGAEARAYLGKWGFYASLRDNHEKPILGRAAYISEREGGHIKGGTDWSEMQGGITYAWKWGNVGLVKEKLQWGNNYNGANIFGGNNPTFAQLKLQISPVKWFDFNYFHGWLNSMVIDSASSYWVANSYGADYREVYHKKFISSNMFTFTPVKRLKISVGNSIIYTDENINPSYLIPLFFYKSVDHSLTSGIDNMNSQMFFDISSRQIKHLHLYATMFIEELSVSRFTKDDEWNFFSYKAGFRLTDLPVSNLSFTTEFTYTYPLVFQHYVPTLTFENAGFNLGHYMKDNSREWYFALDYRPLRTLNINLFFTDAIRGPDYTELGGSRLGNPLLESVEWHNTTYGLKASYQVINDLYTWFSFTSGDISGDVRWSPEYFYGKKNTIDLGLTFGF
jgi:hypothetical protein